VAFPTVTAKKNCRQKVENCRKLKGKIKYGRRQSKETIAMAIRIIEIKGEECKAGSVDTTTLFA